MQLKLLRTALPRFAFSSAPPLADPNEPTIITKHNPEGHRELRGYEHMDPCDHESGYSPIHSTAVNRLALYSVFQRLPNKLARLMGSLFAHPKSAIASESLYLPRIYPNGQPLYDSLNKVSSYIVLNKIIWFACPFNILVFSPEPALTAMLFGLGYYVYWGTNWKLASDLVFKVELVPETEQIVYQKASCTGGIVTKTAAVSDLQHVTFEELFGEDSYNEKGVRGLLNREVAFRVKSTGELLLFDRDGIWNEETLRHSLLI